MADLNVPNRTLFHVDNLTVLLQAQENRGIAIAFCIANHSHCSAAGKCRQCRSIIIDRY